MKYTSDECGFSLVVPDEWQEKERRPGFSKAGGKVAFVPGPSSVRGTLNIAASTQGIVVDREKRERAAIRFLKVTRFLERKWRVHVRSTGRLLDDEPNTVWIEMTYPGRSGVRREVNGLIDAVRDSRVYTIQYKHFPESESAIMGMIESFRFTGGRSVVSFTPSAEAG